MSDSHARLHLFEAIGVELEYMLVDAKSLDVKPVCDLLMNAACGEPSGEIERPDNISWSNELVNHVVELKTTAPTADLDAASGAFWSSLCDMNRLLEPLGARLMGTAMHPWMNPAKETRLWAHEYSDVYAHFDRLFDCKRHGWANLQSMHLNLPFASDDEFGRLHASVRVVLPLLPALCASSPIVGGRRTGMLDSRLDVYRSNQAHTPSLTGQVIPEAVFDEDAYERVIMAPIARDVQRLDPSGIMQPQWMNSRGAIARFDRGSIEIRVMDVQEHPWQDLAIAQGVVGALRWLCDEGPSSGAAQRQLSVEQLRRVFDECVVTGDRARIRDTEYLEVLGWKSRHLPSAGELWNHVLASALPGFTSDPQWARLRRIVTRGPLAERIITLVGNGAGPISHDRLHALAIRLADCLDPDSGLPLDEPEA